MLRLLCCLSSLSPWDAASWAARSVAVWSITAHSTAAVVQSSGPPPTHMVIPQPRRTTHASRPKHSARRLSRPSRIRYAITACHCPFLHLHHRRRSLTPLTLPPARSPSPPPASPIPCPLARPLAQPSPPPLPPTFAAPSSAPLTYPMSSASSHCCSCCSPGLCWACWACWAC